MKLDSIDQKILRILQTQGRLSIVELASQVNLTKTPCTQRVRRLEQSGYIQGYHAALSPEKLDAACVMIVMVVMDKTSDDALDRFNDAIRQIPEVQGCYMVAGNFDYMLKIRTKDISTYRTVLGDRISQLPNVHQTHSFIVMELVKDEMSIPVPFYS